MLYASLFLGQCGLRPELQAEADDLTRQLAEKVAAMTEEQKQEIYERMMKK